MKVEPRPGVGVRVTVVLGSNSCKQTDVQLIPAWIDNVQRVMPKGEVVPVPILCTVTFGAPVALQTGEDRRAFLDRARGAVMALRAVA